MWKRHEPAVEVAENQPVASEPLERIVRAASAMRAWILLAAVLALAAAGASLIAGAAALVGKGAKQVGLLDGGAKLLYYLSIALLWGLPAIHLARLAHVIRLAVQERTQASIAAVFESLLLLWRLIGILLVAALVTSVITSLS